MEKNIKMNIIRIINKNLFNYGDIIKNLYIINREDSKADVAVIIPVRGRSNFLKPLLKSLIACETDTVFKIIVVEHSIKKEHEDTCNYYNVTYAWIKSNQNQIFNKCLCHNIGVFTLRNTKYVLFHDLDCLVKKSFFTNILMNIQNKKVRALRALQTFQKRRVLYCDDSLTRSIIAKEISINDISIDFKGVSLPKTFGAPGGSIFLERSLFYEIGGYDPELFNGYSPEDAFFWDKIENVTKIGLCDNPINEIYHLNHPRFQRVGLDYAIMNKVNKFFKLLNSNQKRKIINYKMLLINKYK